MIVVTGAAGRLGRLVADRLTAQGRDVIGVDRVQAEGPGFQFILGDLTDTVTAEEVVRRADAVVHMGAIPGPMNTPPRQIFENNVGSTFNVLRAAANHGLPRVVFSSSAFGMGWAHDPTAFVPLYLPLDEDHPMMPFEPYGLSKQVGECIGEMVSRSSGTSVVSLRFTNVAGPEVQDEFPWPPPTPESPLNLMMWAYADARDVAQAHILSLDADIKGHEPFLLAQPLSRFREPTVDLIRWNFGDRVEIRGELPGNASVISTGKAPRMLGFRPQHDWTKKAAH